MGNNPQHPVGRVTPRGGTAGRVPSRGEMPHTVRCAGVVGLLCWQMGTANGAEARLTVSDSASNSVRYTIKSWRTDDGLPQSTPRTILQTRDGYLWVGTFNGLARFDGVRFQSFTVATTQRMRSDSIAGLFEDRHGNLWIATDHGLARNRDGLLTSFDEKDGLPVEAVKSVAESAEGDLWVSLQHRLFRRTGERFMELPVTELGSPTNIEAMTLGASGQLWIGAGNGLWELVAGKLQQVSADPRLNIRRLATGASGRLWIAPWAGGLAFWENGTLSWIDEFEGIRCSNMAATRSGQLWFGSMEGDFFRWEDGTIERFGPQDGFGGYRATALAEDRSGNIWVGRGASGLYRMRRAELRTVTKADGLKSEDVTSVAEGKNGTMLLGTFGGGLAAIQNGNCSPVATGGDSAESVTSLLNAGPEGIWIGNWGEKPFRLQDARRFPGPMELPGTRALFQDRAGALWIASNSEGLERLAAGRLDHFNTRNGLSSDHTLCIAQDSQGAVWVGTEKGLNRLTEGKIENFFSQDGLGADHVRALCPDPHGTVFVGTAGGLSAWRGGRWRTLTSRDGLLNDAVSEIVEDGLGNLWLGTRSGLMRLKLSLLDQFFDGVIDYVHGLEFGRDDGLPSIELATGFQPSCLRATDGRLWFCTGAGAVIVDPARVHVPENPPLVHVEEVLADDQLIGSSMKAEPPPHQPAPLLIPSRRSRIEIHYTGINLSAPGALKFRRQLVGYENEWVDVGNQRVAFYTKLPPGKYQFRVIARNNDSVWNETGDTLALQVLPAWYQAWVFRGLVVVAVAGGIAAVVRKRIRTLEQRRAAQERFSRRLIESQEAERKRIAGELHDSLGQNLLVIKNRAQMARQPGTAVETELNEITRLAAQSLDEVRVISQNLRPYQLDRLGLTRALQGIIKQVNASAKVAITANIMPVDRLFPSEAETNVFRILQEALNNILKHSGATEARVDLEQSDSQVQLIVEDNGRGFMLPLREGEGAHGMGLSGIAERARILGGRLDVQSAPGRGTRLKVTMPTPKTGKA